MPNDELLTDDYVAGLLAQDAKDCSLKYSAMGLEAFRDSKRAANVPKPNTRFLRNIIKDTDSHNKALLAKEAAESKARLKDLEQAEDVKRRRTNPNSRDIRSRQMGDIHAILGGKSRQRNDSGSGSGDSRHVRSGRRDDARRSSTRRERESGRDKDDRRRKSSQPSRHGSPSDEEDGRDHGRARRDTRSNSPRRPRSGDDERRRHRRRSRHRSRSREAEPLRKSPLKPEEDDSDPLEDFIGPAPPAKHRGRGAIGGAAALDRRFSESYDPTMDLDAGDDAGGWDDAAEAYRDHMKLRLTQDKRLKEAGFTDEQIEKSKGTHDKTEADVVWTKKGEKRAWDMGKTSDGDIGDHAPGLFSETF